MTHDGDILVDIPSEDWPELAVLYEKHQEEAPYVYCAIKTAIRWNEQGVKKFTFTSPNNCWREDGTIFVFIQFQYLDLLIYTLTGSHDDIYEGLKRTKRIKPGTSVQIYSLHYSLFPTVRNFVKDSKKTLIFDIPGTTYALTVEQSLHLDTRCPTGLIVKRLNSQHVNQINNTWPHKYENSEAYISEVIKLNDCFGLFLEETDELVAWALTHHMGILGIIHTEEQHRKKGYASIITKHLSKEIARLNLRPAGNVIVGNMPSESMFEKNGFQDVGKCTYIKFIY